MIALLPVAVLAALVVTGVLLARRHARIEYMRGYTNGMMSVMEDVTRHLGVEVAVQVMRQATEELTRGKPRPN